MKPTLRLWTQTAAGALAGAALAYGVLDGGQSAPPRVGDTLGPQRPGVGAAPAVPADSPRGRPAPRAAIITTLRETMQPGTTLARNEALFTLAMNADPAGIEGLVDEAAAMVNDSDRRTVLSVLFQRYAMLDPQAALASMRRLGTGDEAVIVPAIFLAWAEVDLDGAIAGVHGLGNLRSMRLAGNAILTAHGMRDEAFTAAIVVRLPGGVEYSAPQSERLAARAREAPRESALAALAIADIRHRNEALAAVAGTWALSAPADALTFGQSIENRPARIEFMQAVMKRWAAASPDAAVQAIMDMPPGPDRHPLRVVALRQIAARDPATALAWAQRIEDGRNFSGYSIDVMREWAKSDVMGAVASLGFLPDAARPQAAGILAGEYAKRSPEDALAWAGSLGTNATGSNALSYAIRAVAAEQPDVAIGYLSSLEPSAARAQAYMNLVQVLNQAGNVAQSAALLGFVPAGYQRQEALQAVSYRWGQLDTQAALAWSETLDGEDRSMAMQSVVSTWARDDFGAASRYVEGVGGRDRRSLVSAAVDGIAASNPTRALAWVEQFEGEDGYDNALMSVLYNWQQREPEKAMEYALDLPGSAERYPHIVNSLTSQWAQRDPETAAAWIDGIADEALRGIAGESAVAHWAGQDLDGATAWVEGWDPGPARDRASASIVRHLRSEPDRAVRWINGIGSPDIRFDAALDVVGRVYRSDPDAARRMLRSLDVTPGEKAQVESTFDRYDRG